MDWSEIPLPDIDWRTTNWLLLAGVGIIAGIIAKILHPGRDPGGFLVTLVIGTLGALGGGYLSQQLGFGTVEGFDFRSIAIATGGAFLVLVIWRLLFGKKRDD